MKTLYALCLFTLAAVVLDIALLHSGPVHAQQPAPAIQIDRVEMSNSGKNIPSRGQVVGFSCASRAVGFDFCYVATVSK